MVIIIDGVGDSPPTITDEGVIEEFLHLDHGTSWIVSSFVVGDCDDEAKTQREERLRSCVDAASGAMVVALEEATHHLRWFLAWPTDDYPVKRTRRLQ